ncbi:MAG: MmgE/PrpD family protein [Betaproteobacteria bacterium]|nr:MmgE/PrpD family protein [Betaproteobacteria bacterium]
MTDIRSGTPVRSSEAAMPGLTEAVALFIDGAALQRMPGAAPEKAKKVIADTFAVIVAGAGSEVAAPLMAYLDASGESGDTPLLGTNVRASREAAALVNGTFGHALDFDDVLSMMPAHPSAIILSALLSAPDGSRLTGSALLAAYITGIEVGARIGEAMTLGHYGRGFHGTGTLGLFSAVAALCKYAALDVNTTRTAFGIAASTASGLQRNFGTMTKPLHTGWAARSALTALHLARSGLTAAPDVLEAKAGFFFAYGTPESDPGTAVQALGNPWVIVDPGIALKRFPCCYASHRGMDGVLMVRKKLGLTAETLAHLECRMPPGGMQVLTYPAPVTGLEGKFSLEYSLAAGVLDGEYTLWSFSDEAVRRPEIAPLLKRIDAHEDARCAGGDARARSSGSRGHVEVIATLHDGRAETVRVDRAPGHPQRELTWDDLRGKFLDCAAHAGLARAPTEAAFERITRLETCDDVGEIVNLLVKH